MHEPQPIGTVIQNRYQILRVLGQGGSGVTYEADDHLSKRRVALKELSLRGLSDWKKLELFDREAQVLIGLDHPAIPQYLDYFQIDTPDNRFYYIVRDLAEGQSLAELVASGQHFSETDVRRITTDILKVLEYLHNLNPPVIHRDIKPQNVIQRADGHIYLIDFGAVHAVYRDTVAMGSTVVGTYGYMAPEQFRGQAFPSTDIYGLGTTLLNLLTHQYPEQLPQKRMKYDIRSYVTLSEGLCLWLESTLEPVIEDRFPSAKQALEVLAHPTNLLQKADKPYEIEFPPTRKPPNTRVKILQQKDLLVVQIPSLVSQIPSLVSQIPSLTFKEKDKEFETTVYLILSLGVLALLISASSLISLFGIYANSSSFPKSLYAYAIIVLLSLLLFLGPGLYILDTFFNQTTLKIEPNGFFWREKILFWTRTMRGGQEELKRINFLPHRATGGFVMCMYKVDLKRYFGIKQTPEEQEWMFSIIAPFIEECKSISSKTSYNENSI